MGLIHLDNMEFYAFHGCFAEEQIAGNRFLVNLTMETNMQEPSRSDRIEDALNYQVAYEIVKTEMAVPSYLLEHVGKRILDRLFEHFSNLEKAIVKVSKLNPPVGGSMRCVTVEMEQKRSF